MFFLVLLSTFLFQGTSTGTSIIDGYVSTLSVFPGDSVYLYLNASKTDNALPVRLYNMQGEIVTRIVTGVFSQTVNSEEEAYEAGFNYKPSARIRVPDLKSGIYLWENKIPMIIKSKNPTIVVLYSSNTENAYCSAGGKSLYGYNSSNKEGATKVSFKRPVEIERFGEAFFRWMDKQNIPDVGYISDMDMDDYKEIAKARLLIITGHSEYWTRRARKNFDHFVSEGNDAMVLSGNTMWWQVRYNKDRDQLICYRKSSADNIKSTKLKTILWNDPTLDYPIFKSIGADFSQGGYGDRSDKGWDGYKIMTESPLLEQTGLKKGDVLRLVSRESDGAPITWAEKGPVFDNSMLGFYKAEIIGFDHVINSVNIDKIGTWIVFKRTASSGVVINVASTNWCSQNGIEVNPQIQRITGTMIRKLLSKDNVFSPVDIAIPDPGLQPTALE